MAEFKFKLDGVLKLREFKEKRVMNEIAEIVKELEAVKDEIKKIHADIDQGYESIESLKGKETKGGVFGFYPYFFKGKNEHLKNAHVRLEALEKKYQRKIIEYSEAKGEVKVIQNLKDKEYLAYKKEIDKKVEAAREEFVIMNLKRSKGRGVI